ncbi:hypothetical protein IJG73_01695, partial [Candidatus Saccharibacteria bacterium]|nr:hypothetical protein [Candidatus Saccharibacteria bacterium]
MFFGSIDYLGLADATDKDLQVNVNVSPILDLRTEKSGSTITELVLSATPNSSGTFVKDNLDVIVNTSNPTGYTLTFANKDTDTALHHTAPTSTDAITSLTATATDTTFPLNTWGYSTGDIASTQSFSPIPISTAPVVLKATAAPASDDTTTVTFGANIGVNIASGTYEDTVVFSATTNYVPPATATFTVAPVVTTNLSGGDTLTLDTDIDWIDDMGQMIVTIYSNATDGSICASPTAVKYQVSGQDKLRITCTSPAKGAGTYNVSLELLKFSQKYVASNTIEYKYRFYTI